ncbi:MAG: M20/M25/M40 family metallo-hydrolase, partial [Planctomycetota bacterium]
YVAVQEQGNPIVQRIKQMNMTGKIVQRILQTRSHQQERNLDFEITWKLSGNPFLTSGGRLIDACRSSIQSVTGTQTELSTGGGTSDGRFIATVCDEVVELGVVNESIHQIDERTNIEELVQLKEIYKSILRELLG